MQTERVQQFAGKMLGVINGAMLALMTSIGRQTGLFEIMADMAPSSSGEIAKATNLHERYVREWLGAMVTGGIVEYDVQTCTYVLPHEHAALLVNAAGPRNLARYTQFVPMLAEVEADVIASFRNGGGVPYSMYPRFQALMAENSALRFDNLLLDEMVPLTGLQAELAGGMMVLDVGCGQGHGVNLLAQAFPNSRFTGYDFSEEGITKARAEAKHLGNPNVHFAVRDVSALQETARYDLVTAFDAIHDQAKPAEVLRGVAEALRPDGTFLMQDIGASSHVHENIANPFAPFLYSLSTMHCMTVSLALDGAGLGTVWGEQQALSMLNQAGFARVDVHRLEADPVNNYYIARKA